MRTSSTSDLSKYPDVQQERQYYDSLQPSILGLQVSFIKVSICQSGLYACILWWQTFLIKMWGPVEGWGWTVWSCCQVICPCCSCPVWLWAWGGGREGEARLRDSLSLTWGPEEVQPGSTSTYSYYWLSFILTWTYHVRNYKKINRYNIIVLCS